MLTGQQWVIIAGENNISENDLFRKNTRDAKVFWELLPEQDQLVLYDHLIGPEPLDFISVNDVASLKKPKGSNLQRMQHQSNRIKRMLNLKRTNSPVVQRLPFSS